MGRSPIFLAFMLAMVFIYLLVNWKAKLFTKILCIPTLAIFAGVLGAIAFTPEDLSFAVFIQVAFLNLIFTGCLYPVLAGRFLSKRKPEELEAQQRWIEENFKKKKK